MVDLSGKLGFSTNPPGAQTHWTQRTASRTESHHHLNLKSNDNKKKKRLNTILIDGGPDKFAWSLKKKKKANMTCYVGLLCYSSNHRNSCNHIISLDKCELIEGPNALISSPSLRPFFCPIQQSANSLIQFGAAPLELRSGAPPPPTLQRHSLGSRHSSFITAAHYPLRLLITSWGWDELSEILMRVSSLRGSRAAQDLARRSIRHPPSRVESLHDFCFSSCCLKVRPDDYALACANDIPVV